MSKPSKPKHPSTMRILTELVSTADNTPTSEFVGYGGRDVRVEVRRAWFEGRAVPARVAVMVYESPIKEAP